jgi:hypothetical protein
MKSRLALLSAEAIQRQILLIRGQKVVLDSTLAELYGVTSKVLLQAVRRNARRFPADFMFTLTRGECATLSKAPEVSDSEWNENLRSQIVTSSRGYGGRRYAPNVFTEQGVAMLSSVLRSGRAIQVNIAIMRAFVQLRQLLATHRELAAKLSELEEKLERHDAAIGNLFETIRQLLTPLNPNMAASWDFTPCKRPKQKKRRLASNV